MGIVKNQRLGDVPIPNFYTKSETEGDLSRFIGAEAGRRQVITVGDTARVTLEDSNPSSGAYLTVHRFDLDIEYLVGANQLLVLGRMPYDQFSNPQGGAPFSVVLPTKEEAILCKDAATIAVRMYFEELSSNSVRIYNISTSNGGQNKILDYLFLVPHTAVPALSQERVTIKDQGDNQALVLSGKGDGLLMTSPNGARFLVRVTDFGNLVTEPR